MPVLAAVRIQAFVTRAYTAGITGLSTGSPCVAGIWSADASATSRLGWPTWPPP